MQTITTEKNKKTETYFVDTRATISGTKFGEKRKRMYIPVTGWSLQTFPIGDWAAWSMAPHDTDEIRNRLITKPIIDTCITYLCRGSRIKSDFFEEFCVLTSGLFHNEKETNLDMIRSNPITYNKENIEYFISVYRHQHDPEEPILPVPELLKQDQTDYAKISKGTPFPSITHISDRIDWLHVEKFQHLTPKQYALYSVHFPIFQRTNAQKAEEVEDVEEELYAKV